MQELSTHKVALEKLQQMLRNYDMSFGISNKMFRMAIVLEILNVQSLFDQLLHKWETRLPVGEGPDADIDFAEWGNYNKWHDLIDAARQNVCIENLSIDCGNGMYIDDFAKSFKKSFKKNMTSVFKGTFGTKRDELLEPFQAIIDDKDGVLTYGEMVFHAINLLLSTLREIDRLLQHPTDEQLLQYYLALDALFVPDYRKIDDRIAAIHKEDKPNRKKENNLKALRDELFDNLIKSGVLDEKITHCNQYELQDFMNEHSGEFTEKAARLIVTVDEFGDLSKDTTKIKIARYLFEQRHDFPVPCLHQFFAYLHGFQLVNKHLRYVVNEEIEPKPEEPKPEPKVEQKAEEVNPDSSFFAITEKMTHEMCKNELLRILTGARSKATACKEILTSALAGYFVLSDKTNQEKADLINPWVKLTVKDYVFTAEDFRKASCPKKTNRKR